MRPAPRYRRACWASAYRFCVAQPCPRLHEAFHLERVTAQSGRQESGSHIASVFSTVRNTHSRDTLYFRLGVLTAPPCARRKCHTSRRTLGA